MAAEPAGSDEPAPPVDQAAMMGVARLLAAVRSTSEAMASIDLRSAAER